MLLPTGSTLGMLVLGYFDWAFGLLALAWICFWSWYGRFF